MNLLHLACVQARYPRLGLITSSPRFFSTTRTNMEKQIALTGQESTLRQFLLDVSAYIGTLDSYSKPELRFTGGWVRDKILGSTSVDIDIGISSMTGFNFGMLMKQYLAQPDARAKYNEDVLGGLNKIEANPEKSKHLETVTTRILGLDIDLVNLRKETYVENSRNPMMNFGTPLEDALRRDATVNALFYNLSSSQVEDMTGQGLSDMERKVIKTPLPPLQTFQDDPLRVLRAIRFASRLNFTIAAEDKQAMRHSSIRRALRNPLKISRERIGDETMKMVKGPNPSLALSLIDRLGLYNEVFTNPNDNFCDCVETARWARAYNQLSEIVSARSKVSDNLSSIRVISRLLLPTEEDVFHAWVVVCFVPWARVPQRQLVKPTSKKFSCAASIAAKEGIKANNKILKIVDNAVSCLEEISSMKNTVAHGSSLPTSPLKRKHETIDRVSQGQAIRRWGIHWRNSMLYAILTEVGENVTNAEIQKVLRDYAMWLSEIESLDLLHADQIKPIVDGNELMKALGKTGGLWIKKALDMTMDWQLRNPDQKASAGAIAEVMERKDELGIP